MKIIELLNAQPVMTQLIDRKMPAKLAYGLAKNFRMINQDLEDYDKARLKILQDNWTLNPEINRYDIPDEDKAKWAELHKELLETESGYQPYKIDLALLENLEMTPGEIMSISWMISGSPLDPNK
jgi:hypothetical protein